MLENGALQYLFIVHFYFKDSMISTSVTKYVSVFLARVSRAARNAPFYAWNG